MNISYLLFQLKVTLRPSCHQSEWLKWRLCTVCPGEKLWEDGSTRLHVPCCRNKPLDRLTHIISCMRARISVTPRPAELGNMEQGDPRKGKMDCLCYRLLGLPRSACTVLADCLLPGHLEAGKAAQSMCEGR